MRMLSFIMIGKSYPNVQNVQIAALEFLEVFYQLCQLVAATKSKKCLQFVRVTLNSVHKVEVETFLSHEKASKCCTLFNKSLLLSHRLHMDILTMISITG